MPQQPWAATWAIMPAAALTLGLQSLASSAQRSQGSSPPYGLYARSDAVMAVSQCCWCYRQSLVLYKLSQASCTVPWLAGTVCSCQQMTLPRRLYRAKKLEGIAHLVLTTPAKFWLYFVSCILLNISSSHKSGQHSSTRFGALHPTCYLAC